MKHRESHVIGIVGILGLGSVCGNWFLRAVHDAVETASKERKIQKTAFVEFSEPVKQILQDWCGIGQKFLCIKENATKPIKYCGGASSLRFVQDVMTYFRKNFSPEIFVDMMEDRTKNHANVIYVDVRYENEARRIRKNGGRIIHIRQGYGGLLRNHESEKSLKIKEDDVVFTLNKNHSSSSPEVKNFTQSAIVSFLVMDDNIDGAKNGETE